MPWYSGGVLVATTALGRVVGLENWKAIQGDQILRALFNVGRANAGMGLTDLSSLTGLSSGDTLKLCQELVRDGYVFDDGINNVYRLTSNGLDRVYSTQISIE